MTEVRGVRERTVWVAVVAVLVTSIAWLGAINLMLIARVFALHPPRLLIVAWVLVRATATMVAHTWPVVALALIGAAVIGWTSGALRPGRSYERGVRHA